MNNAITALAESWRITGTQLAVRNLQIVNGCQTTVTIHSVAPIVRQDHEVMVSIKVIEGPMHMQSQIADATNTQTRLTAEDFKSNDEIQRDLRKQFDSLPSPIFYEIKRGDWETIAGDKAKTARYAIPGTNGFRRLKMKDVAQATLAFLGEPGKAKDQSRAIFASTELYRKVFPRGIRAEQLLLPVELYTRADDICDAWGSQFPGAPYARFCLVALAGHAVQPNSLGGLPSVAQSAHLLAHAGELAGALKRGQMAISAVAAALGPGYPGHREFFRSEAHYAQVEQLFDTMPSLTA
jgi:hypothetical protein